MSDKRNSRPTGDAAEAGKDENSEKDFTTDNGNGQAPRLVDFIPHGRQNAVPGRRLMELLGAKDLRTVSKAVESARRSGVPICASTAANAPGYYIAESPDEVDAYLHSLDHRMKEISMTRNYMEDNRDRMSGQGRLW